jgi:Tfp pilus assembly protein PilF
MSARLDSNDPTTERFLRAATEAVQAHDLARAEAIGEEAVRQGAVHPDLFRLAARGRMAKGDADGALALLAGAREAGPRDGEVLNELGLCLAQLGRSREAVAAFDTALRHTQGATHILFNKALAYEQLGELDREQLLLQRVIDADPNHVPALNLLAMLAAERGDAEAARGFAGRALAVVPDDVLARLALASADIAARDFQAAGANLKTLLRDRRLGPDNLSLGETLMGDALDGIGLCAEAFTFYTEARRTLHAHYARAFARRRGETTAARIARLAAYFGDASPDVWRAKPASAARRHVFLVGFLRSGTTLLGQILAGHPDVRVMHERDCMADAVADFIAAPGGLDRLAAMSDAELEPYRRSYWAKAREAGDDGTRAVLVDKQPLATVHLPLVAKLFPDAKVLFAIRDPRDVVFSCFRRRFAMSEEKYEMLSLGATARAYAQTMALGDIYRGLLGLEFVDTKHEALLADFEGETARLCAALGLAPHHAMKDFASRAGAANIDTPNSAALARGLSRDGEGSWRRYAPALQPVLPVLAPWCARFFYPEG